MLKGRRLKSEKGQFKTQEKKRCWTCQLTCQHKDNNAVTPRVTDGNDFDPVGVD